MTRRKDFFEVIANFPHHIAYYFTFTLEKEVVHKIAEETSANIFIFHDFKNGITLNENYGSRIKCIPVKPEMNTNNFIQNCFHSKLALLKGENKAKLLLGSANLSRNSFSGEDEICFEMELDFNTDLFYSIVSYIIEISNQFSVNSREIRELLEERNKYLTKENDERRQLPGLEFVENSDKSIAEKIYAHLNSNEQPTLRIASPFLLKEKDIDVFRNFISKINPKKIELFVNDINIIPPSFEEVKELNVFKKTQKKSSRKGFHAKIVSLQYSSKEILFIGSANFTNQGFFSNIKNGGNHECGIIITSHGKNLMEEWFNEGWEKPRHITEIELNTDSGEMSTGKEKESPYVWAEMTNKRIIEIYFYIPNKEQLNSIFVDGKKVQLRELEKFQEELNFYKYRYSKKASSIKVKIDNEVDEEIQVFDIDEFKNNSQSIKDDLFSHFQDSIESINYKKMARAIERSGLHSEKGTPALDVVEPPKLEQFYKNVKSQMIAVESKKYYWDGHYERLEKELNENNGAAGIYFASQMYNIFYKKNEKRFCGLCFDRIEKIFSKENIFDITFEEYRKFLNKWINVEKQKK